MAAVLFYRCALLYRCALREDPTFFHCSILVSRCYPQEVESFPYHCRMFWALCALGSSVLGYLLDMLSSSVPWGWDIYKVIGLCNHAGSYRQLGSCLICGPSLGPLDKESPSYERPFELGP